MIYVTFYYIASPTLSTVSGNGVANFVALSEKTVTVQAKTSGGANISTGGDLFYIQISNECTKTTNFKCTVVGGADNTITTPIFTEMTDNNDGTYTYKWTPDNEGKLSIVVVKMNRYLVLGNYYNSQTITGTAVVTNYSSHINYNWGGYDVTPGRGDYVSSRYDTYLKAPYTGTIRFYLSMDNEAALRVDGVTKINRMGNG